VANPDRVPVSNRLDTAGFRPAKRLCRTRCQPFASWTNLDSTGRRVPHCSAKAVVWLLSADAPPPRPFRSSARPSVGRLLGPAKQSSPDTGT
jgi:hypothetical protein